MQEKDYGERQGDFDQSFLRGHVVCTGKTSLEGGFYYCMKNKKHGSWLVRVPMY
jgi:hypothetical protein